MICERKAFLGETLKTHRLLLRLNVVLSENMIRLMETFFDTPSLRVLFLGQPKCGKGFIFLSVFLVTYRRRSRIPVFPRRPYALLQFTDFTH